MKIKFPRLFPENHIKVDQIDVMTSKDLFSLKRQGEKKQYQKVG